MHHISIISASVRTGRKSHRVALFFKSYIESSGLATVEILDLMEYNFPVFNERLEYQPDPIPSAVRFAEKVAASDGVVIVTPEYNGGYPASLKNATDLLVTEWKRKAVALVTVSSGAFGGAQVTTSLLFTLWKIGALMVPAMFPVPKVEENYDEAGVPRDRQAVEKRAKTFLEELIWCMNAKKPGK